MTEKAPPLTVEDRQRDWVRRLLAHERITPTELARRAAVPQSALSRFLEGQSHWLMTKTWRRIAAISTIGLPPLAGVDLDSAVLTPKEQYMNEGVSKSRDLPVWGVYPIGRTGEFRLNPAAVATFHRPTHLSAGRRIAVFYAPDDSMAPRWEEGEPVVVDLARPAAAGSIALIRMTPLDDPNGTESHLFRRYEGRRNGGLVLGRLDGEIQNPIPIQRVLEVRRVLDWKDLLG